MDIVSIYCTVGTMDEAEVIARGLLDDHLVACVNIVPQVRSLYRWEGAIQDEREVLLLAKTTREQWPWARERIRERHSYECPCIEAFEVVDGHLPFLDWIRQETRGGDQALDAS